MFVIKRKRNSLAELLYSVAAFFLIFNPPVSKYISFSIIFFVGSSFYFLFNLKAVQRIFFSKYVKGWFMSYSIFLLYYFIVAIVGCFVFPGNADEEIRGYISTVGYLFSLLVISIAVTIYMAKKGKDYSDLIGIVINAGLIQGLLGVACFFSPQIKSFFNTLMITNSRSDKIASSVQYTPFRNYGFASTLYDSFGFAMSMIAVFALCRALQGYRKYYLAYIIIAFAASINARSSFFLILAGSAGILIYGNRREKLSVQTRKMVFIITGSLLAIGFISFMLRSQSDNALWFQKGIDSIVGFFRKKQDNVGYMVALSDMLFLPKSALVTLFGSGVSTDVLINLGSDVGYVQNIFRFGMIGSVLIYYTFFYVLTKWKWSCHAGDEPIALGLGIIIALFLVKLNVLGYGIGSVTYLPVLMACIARYSEKSAKSQYKGISQHRESRKYGKGSYS